MQQGTVSVHLTALKINELNTMQMYNLYKATFEYF